MEKEPIFVSLLFLGLGLLYLIRPQIMIKLQVWQARKILGADFIPSLRTEKFYRWFGLFFFTLGAAVLIKILN